MNRRCALAATAMLVGCPSSSPSPRIPVPPSDTALRIRIAQAEARRNDGIAELSMLARDHDTHTRELALRGLGRIGGPQALGVLEQSIADPDPDVAASAMSAIGVAASLDDLSPEDATRLGDELVHAISSASRSNDRAPRDQIQRFALATRERAALAGIEAFGRVGGASMQLELARAVGHTVRPPSQLRPLKLENDHGQVKVADPDWDRVALAGLFAPFDAKNPTLAEAAAIALGRLGRRKIELDRWSRLALGLATVFTDRQVRYAAVYALAREQRAKDAPHDTEVEAALAARVTDDEPEIRAQAIAGLAKRGAIEVARKPIEDSLRDRDWRVAVEAVRALAGDHGDDAGRDAVAAALLRRWTELVRGNEADAHVVIEGEKLLAGHADRPLVIAALTALATSAPGETKVAAIARGWIECLAVAAAVRASPHPDVSALASCGHGNLPDHLRLPLVAELVSAGAGDATTRRAALRLVLVHGDARVRAAGIGALPVVWKEDAEDRAAALGTLTSALGATDSFVAGAAVDAALAIYDALPDGPSRATLDAAVVARAAVEHDVELSGSLYDLIAKQKIATGADACRAGLRGHPVRVHAAVECLRVLGEPQAVPIAEPVPPPPVDVASVINHQITWHLVTTRGEIVIALRPDVAPWNVATVVALTRKGFYDGLELHRVVPNFVAQGGDPTMTGAGGPGFSNPAEPGTARDGGGFYVGGVGMADAGRDSGGSQWFVMHSRAAYLDGRYTWIGTVRSGQKSADALLIGDRVLHATVELE